MEFPLGVFSIALATVILPGLSRHHAGESTEHFTATLDWALRLVILLVSPAAVAMLAFAGPLTATTFGYGAFNAHDVQMASYALMAYSWGLLGFSLVKVLAPGYFARQDTQDAGARGAHRARLQHGVERRRGAARQVLRLSVSAHPASPPRPASPRRSTPPCCGADWCERASTSRRPGWGVLLARIVFANAVMAALLIWLAATSPAGWRHPRWQRAARLAMCIVAARRGLLRRVVHRPACVCTTCAAAGA